MQEIFKGLLFINAQDMREKHPETFEAPSFEDLRDLKPEDYVQVALNNERFWTKIVSIEGDTITATVENDLVCNDLPDRSLIEFHKHHIFKTYVP